MENNLMCPYVNCPVYSYWTGLGNTGIIINQVNNHYSCTGINKVRGTDSLLAHPTAKGLVKDAMAECSHIEILNLLSNLQRGKRKC